MVKWSLIWLNGASHGYMRFQMVKWGLIWLHEAHSWAPLTENLAGEERLSQIANSDLAQLNGETLKVSPLNFMSTNKKLFSIR